MHFHLPKPLHGWREFVGEVSVIVLGVAIALAAEQVVEQAHWHNATREAVENMKQDAVGERYALLARYDQRDCIDRRLDEIGALLARHDAGQPIGRVRRVSRPFYSYGTAPSWQVAVAPFRASSRQLAPTRMKNEGGPAPGGPPFPCLRGRTGYKRAYCSAGVLEYYAAHASRKAICLTIVKD